MKINSNKTSSDCKNKAARLRIVVIVVLCDVTEAALWLCDIQSLRVSHLLQRGSLISISEAIHVVACDIDLVCLRKSYYIYLDNGKISKAPQMRTIRAAV